MTNELGYDKVYATSVIDIDSLYIIDSADAGGMWIPTPNCYRFSHVMSVVVSSNENGKAGVNGINWGSDWLRHPSDNLFRL